jgi:nicotinamide mononucleotide transporter
MWAYIQQNPYEFWGFVTSLICVWLNARENVWGWGWAILSAGLSAKLFYDQRLFGDMYLQFFFIGSAFYGIYSWLHGGKQNTTLPIAHITWQASLILGFVSVLTCFLLIQILASIKGDAVYLDSITTTLSLLGQYMLARKYIENWAIWIIANVLYVGLYFQKDMWLYGILYAIFIALALYGWWSWLDKKQDFKQKPA